MNPAVTGQRKKIMETTVPSVANTRKNLRILGKARSRKASAKPDVGSGVGVDTRSLYRRSIPLPGDRSDDVDEAGDGSQNDADEKEPVGVQPVIQQLAN